MSLGICLCVLGFLFVPVSAQWLGATVSTAPLRSLGAALVGVGLARLVTEIVAWSRSAPPDRGPERAVNLRLTALTLFSLYLVSEVGATALTQLDALDQPFHDFRERQTLASTALLTAHPFLLYTHNPELSGVNALGFRDRDWPVEKPPGTIRIACVGASTTQDGYTTMLAQELGRRFPDRRIEVLNFAVGGWTTAQSLINYVLNARQYSPDWIVLHHAANDKRSWGRGRTRTDYSDAYTILAPTPGVDAFWVRYYNSYAFGKYLFYRAYGRDAGVGLYEVMWSAGDTPEGPPTSKDVELFVSNIQEIVRVAQADGTHVLMTTQPYSLTDLSWSPYWVEGMQMANAAIRHVARELQLPLVDVDSLITGNEAAFGDDPIHLRPEAVQVKARAIAKRLAPLLSQEERGHSRRSGELVPRERKHVPST